MIVVFVAAGFAKLLDQLNFSIGAKVAFLERTGENMRINWNRNGIVFAALILLCLLTAPLASAQNFVPTGSLNVPRQGQTATLLNNGLVLIAGGYGLSGVLSSAELYNPATGTSTLTGSLNVARELHTATLLNNGTVLIAGGFNGSYLAGAELYDPATGTFTITGSLNIPRLYHTATLLNTGMVLITGGGISGNAELYNPATGIFTYTGAPIAYRYAHTATLLQNSLVLLAGGINLTSAELYDPTTGTFFPTGSLNIAREFHTATALNDGTVLIAGGVEGGLGGTFLSSAELYNPANGTFTLTGSMMFARLFHTATLLNSAWVLVAGGDDGTQQTTNTLASAELYNPGSGTFNLTGSMNVARLYQTATLLNNGTVLVTGGGGLCGCILASDELYEPPSNLTPFLLGAGGTTTNPTGSFAEPVNTATGDYYFTATDLAVNGRGIPFVFNRYYNSLDTYRGPLGSGWTHTYNVVLTTNPDGAVTIKQQDGSSVSFAPNGSGGYSPSTVGLFDILQQNSGGSFTLTKPNQIKLLFSALGRLLSVRDRNGNTQQMTYNASGNLVSITDTAGRVFTLSYDNNNHLILLSDPIGRTVSYTYDVNGNLISGVNPAGGITQYSYNSTGQMTSAVDARGTTYVQNTYDSAGRVVAQNNGRGATTQFAYNTPSSGVTTITDANGNTIQHLYDANMRLIEVVDGSRATTTFSYDSNNDRTGVTDPNGHLTAFTYDSNGNLTSVVNALGSSVSLTYDNFNDVINTKDPAGHVTSLAYDAKGNLTKLVDALGNTSSLSHDALGQLLGLTDANGHTTTFGWDNLGNRSQSTDGAGRTTTFAYDAVGRMISSTDGLGHTTKFQYDALSRISDWIDVLGGQTHYAYDAIGDLTVLTDANGHATSYQYDSAVNLVTMVDALTHQTAYKYDANNNLISVTNARGKVSSYSYDASNRRFKRTDPLGRAAMLAYDLVGNLISVTYANGSSRTISYDAANRPTTLSYADGTAVSRAYDPNGNRTSMTDSLGITSYSYDFLNRLTAVTRFDGKKISHAYDSVGNRSALIHPDGKSVLYRYDPSNRLMGITDWNGGTTTYMYDAAARLVSTALPNGIQSSYTYDQANRLIAVSNASPKKVLSRFQYLLDAVGNRTQVRSQLGTTTYVYDALNELISSTGVPGISTQYSYDATGNRTSLALPDINVPYSYDDADELISAGPATFTYDGNGNRASETVLGITTTYGWDSANRLKSVSLGPLADVQYGYDGDGNRISMSTPFSQDSFVNDIGLRLPRILADYTAGVPTDYVNGYAVVAAMSAGDADYLDYDGLGSTANISQSNGRAQGSFAYDVWGEPLNPAGGAIPRFAGQSLDTWDNLYYMRARYYDPAVGRFLSNDPLGARFGGPYDQNRYVYARNNPLRYVDPSGLSAEPNSIADVYQRHIGEQGGLGAGFKSSSTTPNLIPLGLVVGICVVQPEICIAAGLAIVDGLAYLSTETASLCLQHIATCTNLIRGAATVGLARATGSPSLPPGAVPSLDPWNYFNSTPPIVSGVNDIWDTFGSAGPDSIDTNPGAAFSDYLDDPEDTIRWTGPDFSPVPNDSPSFDDSFDVSDIA